MEIRAQPLDLSALEGVGILATPTKGKVIEDGAEFSFEFAVTDLGMPAGLCAGRLECSPRPMRLSKMERHLKTPELLSAVDADAIIAVAPPQEPLNGRLTDVRAVIIRAGQAIVLAVGTWHWIPYPLGDKSTRFLVVYRNATADDDLEFCELAEANDILFDGDTA